MKDTLLGFPTAILEEMEALYQKNPSCFNVEKGKSRENCLVLYKIFGHNQNRSSILLFPDAQTQLDMVTDFVNDALDTSSEERKAGLVDTCLESNTLLGIPMAVALYPLWIPSGQFRMM